MTFSPEPSQGIEKPIFPTGLAKQMELVYFWDGSCSAEELREVLGNLVFPCVNRSLVIMETPENLGHWQQLLVMSAALKLKETLQPAQRKP